jgi:hypothetical protein
VVGAQAIESAVLLRDWPDQQASYGGTPMIGKQRLVADQDRVIAKKLEIIAILERHRQADTDKMIAECRRVITECEKSKALILAA